MRANQQYQPPVWRRRVVAAAIGSLGLVAVWSLMSPTVHSAESLCPEPVLQRLATHTVQGGETLESIAADYGLLPITVLALNPTVRSGTLSPGMALTIPPFNGTAIAVPAGQTWQDLAATYGARADVLFEVNGCPSQMPSQAFIPGVSWLLEGNSAATATAAAPTTPLSTYPLAAEGQVIANYGWRTDPTLGELVFSSGVTVETAPQTAVVAAGSGTVAYVGDDPSLGTLIVVNHQQGLQTRYARVMQPQVKTGDRVQAGQALAIATPYTEDSSILHFEVRTNSSLGWVARDPGNYLPALAVR